LHISYIKNKIDNTFLSLSSFWNT